MTCAECGHEVVGGGCPSCVTTPMPSPIIVAAAPDRDQPAPEPGGPRLAPVPRQDPRRRAQAIYALAAGYLPLAALVVWSGLQRIEVLSAALRAPDPHSDSVTAGEDIYRTAWLAGLLGFFAAALAFGVWLKPLVLHARALVRERTPAVEVWRDVPESGRPWDSNRFAVAVMGLNQALVVSGLAVVGLWCVFNLGGAGSTAAHRTRIYWDLALVAMSLVMIGGALAFVPSVRRYLRWRLDGQPPPTRSRDALDVAH